MKQDLRFKGQCIADCNGSRVTIAAVREEDIEPLSVMYQQTWINDENYLQRLSPSEPRSFQNIGGMFEILDKKKLTSLLDDPDYCMLTAKDTQGSVLGLIWYSNNPGRFETISPNDYFPGKGDWHTRLEQAKRDEDLIYGGEILLSPENKVRGIPLLLFHVMLEYMCSLGFHMGTGEVYKVYCDLFPDEEQLNIRSYKTLLKVGGDHAGSFPPKLLKIGTANVEVASQIFLWDIPSALERIMRELGQIDIHIVTRKDEWDEKKRTND